MKYQHANKRILVVSDDPSAREALGEMLRAADFNVLLAENGRSAVRTLMANPVSVIVLDFRTRFDAEDSRLKKSKTLSALTDVDPLLPLILTCDADAELDHETALMADLVLKHPVQPSALLDAIDTLLGESLRERVYRKSDYIATLR
jgi:DNA-binding NtrC family response regulator